MSAHKATAAPQDGHFIFLISYISLTAVDQLFSWHQGIFPMHLYSSHGFSLKLHNLWQDQRFVFLACSWRCYGPLFSCWCHFLVSWGPDDARSWKTREYYEFLKSVTHGSGDWEGPVGISSPASSSHWANTSPCFPNVTLHYPLPCSCWLLFTWLLWLSRHFHLGQQGH